MIPPDRPLDTASVAPDPTVEPDPNDRKQELRRKNAELVNQVKSETDGEAADPEELNDPWTNVD